MANIGYIQVNRYCNQKCHFCSNPFTGRSITLEKGMELVDDFITRKYDGVLFTGGEPTLAKNLPDWIAHASKAGIASRMISNGLKSSDPAYLKSLYDAGLRLVHFSLYSYRPQVHDYLTATEGAWKQICKAIENALSLGITVQINTVISSYNQDHLDKTVLFLNRYFPAIRHQVWNNLDPIMMRKTPEAVRTLPTFAKFEAPLRRAMEILTAAGRTFRAEKVPLCYMRGFEEFSTETRKLVKEEERIVHFLDIRSFHRDAGDSFRHDYPEGCQGCDLRGICAGITEASTFYKSQEPRPVKLAPGQLDDIVRRIRSGE